MEGEGSPSEVQTEDPTGQSWRDGGVEVGLEIDGCAVDATIAVDGGGEGSASLIGGKGRVIDKEELCADTQDATVDFAAVYPDGGTVGNLLGGGEAVVSYGETQPCHEIPERGVVGGVEHDLIAGDGGARGAGHGVDGLDAVEESELVALDESGVVVDDSLRELRHGGCRADSESAEADATHEDVGGVLGHADARQGAACNLVRREDGAAVEFDGLGDIDLDHINVGLDEGVEDRHLRGQVLVALAEHRVELLVDGSEVGPLRTAIHLPGGATRDDGFDGQLADDGAALGLAVEQLPHLAADFGVDTEDFCHNVVPFCV